MVALFALCVTAAAEVSAGVNAWSTQGPPGGMFRAVVIDPSDSRIVYAAYSRTLHKSINGGDTWQTIRDFKNQVNSLAIDQDGKLYVATQSDGMLRSDNVGTSFVQIVASSAVGPWSVGVSGSTVYYSTGGLFRRSTDRGATWTTRTVPPQTLSRILVDPNNTDSIFGFAGPYLLRSIDGGASWTQITVTTGAFVTSVNNAVLLSSTSLIACAQDGYYISSDAGSSWSRNAMGMGCLSIAVDPNLPGAAIAGFGSGARFSPIYRTTDYGSTWTSVPHTVNGPVEGIAVARGAPAPVVVVNSVNAWRSTLSGAPWTIASQGPIASTSSLAGRPGASAKVYAYAAGFWTGTSALYSSTGGSAWNSISLSGAESLRGSTFNQAALGVKPGEPNTLYLAPYSGFVRSTNGGTTWSLLGTGLIGSAEAIAFDPSSPSVMYAKVGTGGTPSTAIFRSGDGGATWSPQSTSLSVPSYSHSMVVDPSNPQHLLLAANEGYPPGSGGLYRSLDGGVTWSQQFTGENVRSIAFNPADPRTVYVATTSGLQKSVNGGVTFTANAPFAMTTNQPAGSVAIDPIVPTTVYAASLDFSTSSFTPQKASYVLRSVDDGATWEALRRETDLPIWPVNGVLLDPSDPSILHVSTDARGIGTIEIAPDLVVSVSEHAGARPLGISSSFNVRAQNLGPYAATVVQIVISLPPGLGGVTVTPDRGTCIVGGETVTCSVPVLRMGQLVNVNVAYAPASSMLLPVTATVTAHEPDMFAGNNSATATATAGETVDLSVVLSPSATTATHGDTLSYSLTVSNSGPVAASDAVVTMTPGSNLILGAPPSGCAAIASTIVCTTGALAIGANRVFNIPATLGAAGSITATASVVAGGTAVDILPANNTSIASVAALAAGDISVSIAESTDPVSISTNFEYRVSVRNAGPDSVTNVTTTLNNTGTTVAVASTRGTCTTGANGIACNVGVLEDNATALITVTTASSSAGSISLIATAVSDGTDRVGSNNSAQEFTQVSGPTNTSQSGGGGTLSGVWLIGLALLYGARRKVKNAAVD